MKLWRENPQTPEGKYPIVLRRDGTPLESRYIVMTLKDPATEAALRAYAASARAHGMDPEYADSIERLADQCPKERAQPERPADPDAGPHRTDNPVILAWARSLGCPGS